MGKITITTALLLLQSLFLQAQNMGIGTASPNTNAILEIQSSSKGLLIPRMDSATRKLIPNTVGLLVYDSSTKTIWQNTGSSWQNYLMVPKGNNNGDLMYWNNNNWNVLPAGGSGKVLTMNGSGIPSWQNTAPTLYSLLVSPTVPVIQSGQTQQFTASGLFWDSSVSDITNTVIWSSSNTAVATINSSGLATSTGNGTSIIKARSGIISDTTVLTVGNCGSAPFAISINDVSQNEGSSGGITAFVFTVTLSPANCNQVVTVNYTTSSSGATASASIDYTPASGTLTFNPGESTKTITVNVGADLNVEPTETFFINLANPINAFLSDAQGLGTIINDD